MTLFLGFVLLTVGGVAGCLLLLYGWAVAWTTVKWLLIGLFCVVRGRPAPHWKQVFKSLEGGNQ